MPNTYFSSIMQDRLYLREVNRLVPMELRDFCCQKSCCHLAGFYCGERMDASKSSSDLGIGARNSSD